MAVMIKKPLSLKWLGCMITEAIGLVFPKIQLKNGTLICYTVYLESLKFWSHHEDWIMKVLSSQKQPKIFECEKVSFREEGTMAGLKGIA